MFPTWMTYLAFALVAIALLGMLLKIKIVPKRIEMLLLVLGGGFLIYLYGIAPALSVSGASTLALSGQQALPSEIKYDITPAYDTENVTYTPATKVLNVKVAYNTSGTQLWRANTNNLFNFTVSRLDSTNNMAVASVTCDALSFTSEATTSDTSSYNIVTRDSALKPYLTICATNACASSSYRSKTFITGGETNAQSFTTQVRYTYDTTGVKEMANNTAKDVTCQIAGETWYLRNTKVIETH